MSTINSLTRRLEKLQTAMNVDQPPDHVCIFYDMDRPDKDAWLKAETARVLEAHGGPVRTIFYMPNKETNEENAARYAAYRE